MLCKLSRGALLLAWLGCMIAFAAPQKAGAVVTFTHTQDNLISSMTVQAVVPIAGGYRMFLTSGGYQVLSATSTNHFGWTLESGVRLSTSASVTGIDASSITSVGIYISTTIGDPWTMYYVAIDTRGFYSIVSATSTDSGTTWGKSSTGTYLLNNGGAGFLDSPRPIQTSATALRLFYIADNAGTNARANYRIHRASSADGGKTFTAETTVLASQVAYQVSVTTLTDARTRLYYAAPLAGQTTGSQILSGVSTNGETFTAESGVRLSTGSETAEISYPVVVRGTDSWRWRMFVQHHNPSTGPFSSDALTLDPLILTMTPTTILNSGTAISWNLTGEIFGGATPAVSFYIAGGTIAATGEVLTSDLAMTGTINPLGATPGNWNTVVTNTDGRTGTLSNAFLMDLPPGKVTVVDNLFRPLKGGTAQISVETTAPGRMRLRIFTTSGGLVTTLADQDMPAGNYQFSWDGRTSAGNYVASGVYLLHINARKANTTRKIVVIK
jgi:hypothetical protein